MAEQIDYVWYACYGSNINKQRFLLYIEGGQQNIEGAQLSEEGARNKAHPIEERSIDIPFSLYFAKRSSRWGGGCAFLNAQTKLNLNDPADSVHRTLGKMYLITSQQFIDIMNQENCTQFTESEVHNAINKVVQEPTRQLVICKKSWYGNLVHLGHAHRSGDKSAKIPIVTFTSPIYYDKLVKPSISYIRAIYKGIEDLYEDYTIEQYTKYFLSKNGIKDHFTKDEIRKILSADRGHAWK